jgi:hypothetical protein
MIHVCIPINKNNQTECPGVRLQNHMVSWNDVTLLSPLSSNMLSRSGSINMLFTFSSANQFRLPHV